MAVATLSPGLQVVALQIQEAGIMHGDVATRLGSAISAAHKGTGDYAYYVNHDGDGSSGDVVYSKNGKLKKAPYELSSVGGKTADNVDCDNAVPVNASVSYQEQADDDDHYASMEESFKRDGLYNELPLYERFIAKSERSAASEDDFAGKSKSFPILKPEDVSAAVHAMGRAGDKNVGPSTLKSRIIAIAKRKGWQKYLPKTWQGDTSSTESRGSGVGSTADGERRASGSDQGAQASSLKLSESVGFPADIQLSEAFKPSYQIKLIAPGPGSSAFYPAEVLKRDGPKVFKAGTPMRIDHPTKAEESARPEGSVKDWGAVLAKDAYWLDDHPKGPGLYSEVKPFSDHVQTIDEKGAYAGVSIRANGRAVMESGKPVMKNGLPVLASFDSAEGVDMVTRAGAGGMFLSESARAANQQEVDMTEADVMKLLEAERTKWENEGALRTIKTLEARALRGDAMVEANRILGPMSLHESAKARVIDSVTRDGVIPTKDGAVDIEKFKPLVMAEAQREGSYLSQIMGGGRVIGMGSAQPVTELTEAQLKESRKEAKRARKEQERLAEADVDVFTDLMGDPRAAKNAALRLVS